MKQIYERKIHLYINNKSLVRIYYFNDEFDSKILKNSQELLLVSSIRDFCFDGYVIFVKKFVKKIEYSKEYYLNMPKET
jgi:hypothetical protein